MGSEIPICDLRAWHAARPPHSDNLIAVVKGHDRFVPIGQNRVQQFALDDVIGPMVAVLPHVELA